MKTSRFLTGVAASSLILGMALITVSPVLAHSGNRGRGGGGHNELRLEIRDEQLDMDNIFDRVRLDIRDRDRDNDENRFRLEIRDDDEGNRIRLRVRGENIMHLDKITEKIIRMFKLEKKDVVPKIVKTTRTTLSGSNEVPANNSTATGSGIFTINTRKNTVRFNITFSGLSGTETGAHIHGFVPSGSNAPIIFTLPSGSPKTGVWNYLESEEADILAGKTYVNIHSTVFPNGEIRGQIVF